MQNWIDYGNKKKNIYRRETYSGGGKQPQEHFILILGARSINRPNISLDLMPYIAGLIAAERM